jgi:hypothetical protein
VPRTQPREPLFVLSAVSPSPRCFAPLGLLFLWSLASVSPAAVFSRASGTQFPP